MTLPTRWVKVLRDVQDAPGRLLMIVAALTVSLMAVVAMLTTFTVLRREVPRSFLSSHPASARLSLEGTVPDDVLRLVRARRDVAMADVSGRMSAQLMLTSGESLPVLLFIVPAFTEGRVDALHRETSANDVSEGLMIERSALALTRAAVGEGITLRLPNGSQHVVRVAGTVHDPGVAPAWQEQVIYAYATPAMLGKLGVTVTLDQLKLVARDSTASLAVIDRLVHDLTDSLTARGHVVRAAQVPPAREHPHQSQMNAIVTMLLIFSLLGLLLGGLLTATVISALLAQQVRQFAIMKAIGAGTAQIRRMYVLLAGVIGVTSVLLAVPLGVVTGRALVRTVSTLLNLRLDSLRAPWWVLAGAAMLGVVTPMLAAAVPVQRAARRTVRASIDEHDARDAGDAGLLATVIRRLRLDDIAATLAARNAVRRRTRLLMTAGLLAGAGAMCIASLDLRAAWEAKVSTAARDRQYDIELHLRDAVADSLLRRVAGELPTVAALEGWNATGAVRETDDSPAGIGRVHADGGHGALTYRAAQPATSMIAHRMAEGRWLVDGDTDAVVINSMARSLSFADVVIGERVSLRINGTVRTLTLVGIMHESLTQSTAYVTPATFAAHTNLDARSSAFRVRMADRSESAVTAEAPRVAQAFERAGVPVRRVLTSGRMAAAQGGHVYILVATLALIAVAMAVTGLIGLASALGVSVLERTREFGVMRGIGASRSVIVRSVVLEGLCMAVCSLLPAVVMSRLLSGIVGAVLASVAQQDLVLSLSLSGVAAWAMVLALAAAMVSAFPANRAASLTVRDAITHT